MRNRPASHAPEQSEATAVQVVDDDPAPADTAHLREKADGLGLVEVMHDQRGVADVERLVRVGQALRVDEGQPQALDAIQPRGGRRAPR